ncbi:cation/H(+) symporter 13 [Citrus clementina]|uniref:cation/H(+) symporter 13 n=1 Tax=Citrus clementina TaxID=85681 RepID=UPI000CED25CF|nr:cation/H(+) symporter 13 [Citrus x clementina]
MGSRYVLRTFAEFGMILHAFVLGVQIDLGLVKHIRKRAVIIGITSTLLPLVFGLSSFRIVQRTSHLDDETASSIAASVVVNSMTSLVVITGLLKELKMLNSELGRLAASITIVSHIFGWSARKFTGVIVPSLFFGMSFLKASCLALIMCCRGIAEIAVYCMWKDRKIITNQIFAIMITNMVIITGISTTIVGYLYDPSRRYKLDVRRAICKSKQNSLRILVCIHKEQNVNPLISLLEVSNPTRNSPIAAFVLQLMELKGSVTAFLKPHHQQTKSEAASSTQLINAFTQFQRCYYGHVVVQHFTTIAPYATMHDDVCTLALDKRVVIIIVPFHKQWGVGGILESTDLSIRALNRNVLHKAPCSVGILVHRGQNKSNRPVYTGELLYHIVMLFIGGADDREALAYSRRMAEHPNTSLTVVWFITTDQNRPSTEMPDDHELDNQAFDEFKDSMVGNKIIFREEIVKDGIGTTQVIQAFAETFDLFIVGKNHDPCCKATLGLSEWIEYPELGILGDTLVNSNDEFSVLVVQQQPKESRHELKSIQ